MKTLPTIYGIPHNFLWLMYSIYDLNIWSDMKMSGPSIHKNIQSKHHSMKHLFFFFSFLGLPPFASLSVFLVRISRIKSKNTLSTFSLVFADVSTYGTFQLSALFCAWDCNTWRFSFRSHLLPTKMKGMVSSLLTRRICSRNSWLA